jgi:alpha-1,2-mannosyltransferase
VLASWWRAYSSAVVPALASVVALMYAVTYSTELGQANFPVLLLVALGLWQEQKRPVLAGLAIGLACMMKMSPAVIVLWWMVRGQYRPVLAALGAAVGSSVLTLPLMSWWRQLVFYREVLPGFGSGDYNGLVIKIEMFGNHSLPNLWHQYFPGSSHQLSPTARLLSAASAVGVVGGLVALFARPTEDRVKIAAQGCALLVGMLLVPVYTYEHHLIFAIPAMVLGVVAVVRGWLPRWWAVLLGVALPVLCMELSALRMVAMDWVTTARPGPYIWVQEAKFVALLVVGASMIWLGSTALPDPSRPPPPRPAVQP